MKPDHEIAIFGGGCFWCTEAVFNSLKGIISVMPGYSGGTTSNPTYEQVCQGNTGHIESVRIEYDPNLITYADLLAVFFNTHDPTTFDRQGMDIGSQYRSVIFYANDEQHKQSEDLIRELNESHAYDAPVITELRPASQFYDAEDYHRQYFEHHKDAPYCQLIIGPKLEKLQKRYVELLK
jgi:peptide-methionine (S)-S-oxide reductase